MTCPHTVIPAAPASVAAPAFDAAFFVVAAAAAAAEAKAEAVSPVPAADAADAV